MDENQTIDQDRIMKINIEQEMKASYIDYSMSVIVSRALPDVRDGFKPVHRRILYGMLGLGNTSDKPYKNITLMVTVRCMVRWCAWDRIGTCDTSLLTDRVTLVA